MFLTELLRGLDEERWRARQNRCEPELSLNPRICGAGESFYFVSLSYGWDIWYKTALSEER